MGINQWTRWYIHDNFSRICNISFSRTRNIQIKPGEYLIKYDLSTDVLLIKDPQKGEIVARGQLSHLVDDDPSAYSQELLDAMQRLQKKNYRSAGGGYSNHHIIPDHVCKKSRLVKEGEKFRVFNKDGSENLMPLPDEFHKKHHAQGSPYSNTVSDILKERWSQLVAAGLDEDPDQIKQDLLEIVDVTREILQDLMKHSGSTIRDF